MLNETQRTRIQESCGNLVALHDKLCTLQGDIISAMYIGLPIDQKVLLAQNAISAALLLLDNALGNLESASGAQE